MTTSAQVLVVEDDADWLDIYADELHDDSYVLHTARTVKQASAKIKEMELDVVVTDLRLIGDNMGGMGILDTIKSTRPDIQVIIFTGYGSFEDAQQALRRGAYDYLTKPLDYNHARLTIRAAISVRQQFLDGQKKRRERLEAKLSFPDRFLYSSTPMRETLAKAAQQADRSDNVLILGPTGTGKGLLAEAIHFGSKRGQFALVNCTSLSERTLERTLFGYADEIGNWNPGYLETLAGGTLVLDTVSGLSKRLQVILAQNIENRVLSTNPDRPPISLTVRIIGIDQSNIRELVETGLFDKGLYDQLAQDVIDVPPLRDRRDERHNDISLLAEYFITKFANTETLPELTPDALERLLAYPFPENVRELQMIMRRAIVQAIKGEIMPHHLPAQVVSHGIQAGLGITSSGYSTERVLCPHGNFLCNQVENIREGFLNVQRVYLRVTDSTQPGVTEQVHLAITRLGFNVQRPVSTEGKLTLQCRSCIPIQMSRFAVVDLSPNDPNLLYEIGMMHSLGVHTLLLKAKTTSLENFTPFSIIEYENSEQIGSIVEKWLQTISVD
ncbi:MAG: sigma 54-interacting transcriptional regulator [Anaerolineae bacterium]|nr:sigma 54-interacting transcriptional regulator [Anaerolineae bacterium]